MKLPFINNKQEQKIQKEDIQGIVVRAYKSLNAARYVLLQIIPGNDSKEYLNGLIENYITPGNLDGDPKVAVNIAFTSSGLENLGLQKDIINSFSREFAEGMSYSFYDRSNNLIEERRTLLGDIGRNNPANWHWGNDNKVDCVIMLYAENTQALNALQSAVFSNKKGVEIIHTMETFETKRNISKEHFGFRDGISQPLIAGLGSKSEDAKDKELIKPGEFILGYLNEYDNYSPSPAVPNCDRSKDLDSIIGHQKKNLGKNGTYMVFRQIEQHVEKFWDFLYHNSKEKHATQLGAAIKLGSKMIGRWPEGQPIVTCPEGGCPITDNSLNDFNFNELDEYGVNCPLGAHIRRTNPRDQVHTGRGPKDSLAMSKRHRMLRRGRIYGEPLAEKMDIEKMLAQIKQNKLEEKKQGSSDTTKENEKVKTVRGLHFICMVSDIGRQFEFIQSVWANTSTFGDLCNEVDPMISPRPTKDQPHCHEFTTPQEIVRNRYKNVPEFTTVVGGAYFFMPGIKALKYILKL